MLAFLNYWQNLKNKSDFLERHKKDRPIFRAKKKFYLENTDSKARQVEHDEDDDQDDGHFCHPCRKTKNNFDVAEQRHMFGNHGARKLIKRFFTWSSLPVVFGSEQGCSQRLRSRSCSSARLEYRDQFQGQRSIVNQFKLCCKIDQ